MQEDREGLDWQGKNVLQVLTHQPCSPLKSQSALIFVIFLALFSTFNRSALIFVNAKKLSALISFMLQK
jgi:hypothetical protein